MRQHTHTCLPLGQSLCPIRTGRPTDGSSISFEIVYQSNALIFISYQIIKDGGVLNRGVLRLPERLRLASDRVTQRITSDRVTQCNLVHGLKSVHNKSYVVYEVCVCVFLMFDIVVCSHVRYVLLL